MTLTFDHDSAAASAPQPVRAPGHGDAFTDHMYTLSWNPTDGWHKPELGRLRPLTLHPGTIGLHYAQVIFEGLKAHRQADGGVAVFRPWDHARRFQRSARRLAMPELPEDVFVDSIEQVLRADQGLLSDDPSHSIYLRPMMFGADANLMLRPSHTYEYLMMAFVAGGFFGKAMETVSVWISHEHSRAIPGGTGNVKCAGNYSGSFVAQLQAQEAGCQQVVWLDPLERTWIEEMGGMNMFFVRGSGPGAEIVTPALSGSLLPGVTRDTLLGIAESMGYVPREEKISLEQWRRECAKGRITEVFASGTAAVVTPVGHVKDRDGDWTIGDGEPGPVTLALREALVDLHHGTAPDPKGWLHRIS
ncbi:branched-chain amino acid aminotransferase [Streptomyces sp. NPDC058955]|uniref:branched-chain amino acid aminotransferase n=1 Tax=unclassified Streptomyces TaxID=2593676 RepID=UPI0036465D22